MNEPQDLQFERAELAGGEAAETFQCALCALPMRSFYYEANGRHVCEACRYRVEQEEGVRPGARGFLRAALAGLGAAAVGSGLYYGVRAVTGYEVGLVAILVGIMVGRGVRWGIKGKGGGGYQALAVFLTYMAIASTYLPAVFEQTTAGKGSVAAKPAPSALENKIESLPMVAQFFVALGFLFALAAAMPIMVGVQSPILLLIVGFGLWEAWKINRRRTLTISGPFQIGATPRSAPAG
jgi:hypothetical protein